MAQATGRPIGTMRLDRQVGIVYPDGTEATAEYDANGNVVRSVDPRGTEITLQYDEGDRLVERRLRLTGSDAVEREAFEYDALGRLVRVTTGTGEIQQTYDSLSRLLTESQAGHTVRITYDAAGRATALDYPGGESVRRTFDVLGRVTNVDTAAGTPIAAIEYRAGDRIARVVLGGIMQATCVYDGQERLESVTYVRSDDGTLVEGFRYAYDDANRIVYEVQLSDGVGERYEFDNANRPVRARYGVRDVLDPASALRARDDLRVLPGGALAPATRRGRSRRCHRRPAWDDRRAQPVSAVRWHELHFRRRRQHDPQRDRQSRLLPVHL